MEVRMDSIALIISLIALGLVLLTRSKVGELGRGLNENYGTINGLDGKMEELKAELGKIKFAQLKTTGRPIFNKDMKIHDAIKLHPDAQSIFASFHLGGCSSCAVGENETIEEGALTHEVDMEKLLEALNKL